MNTYMCFAKTMLKLDNEVLNNTTLQCIATTISLLQVLLVHLYGKVTGFNGFVL